VPTALAEPIEQLREARELSLPAFLKTDPLP
jgi:hypothetical protein